MARTPRKTASRGASKPAKKKSVERWTASSPVEYETADGEVETVWCRLGSAFPLKKGEGFTILLNALPTNGKIVIMPYEPEEGDDAEAE